MPLGRVGSSPTFPTTCPDGGIGRHGTLKMFWPVKAVRVRVPLGVLILIFTIMYRKPRTKLRLHFNHSLSNFDEDMYFSNEGHQIRRSPMRRRYNKEGQNPSVEWYSDLGHGHCKWHTMNTMIEGFINKNIGNRFNDVFHKFMNKPRIHIGFHCYGYYTPRSMFLDFFERDRNRRYEGDYYIDNDGLIQQIPLKPRRPRDIIIRKGLNLYERQYTYTIREDAILSISKPFIALFGKDLYDRILSKRIFDDIDFTRLYRKMSEVCSVEDWDEAFSTVRRYREYKYYFYISTSDKWKSFLFTYKDNDIEHIIRYGTKEYFQYIKEQKRLKALKKKEQRHPDRSHYETTLKTKKLARNGEKRTKDFKQRLKNIFEKEV